MDKYDFEKDFPKKPKVKLKDRILRGIGRMFFLATLCAIVFFGYTYANPFNIFNPFPPDYISKTASPTPLEFPTDIPVSEEAATEVPTEIVEDATPLATDDVFLPTETPILLPTQTPVDTNFATETPETMEMPFFVVQSGNPVYVPHPDGCEYMYVAGSVTDGEGNPLIYVGVELNGTIANKPLFSEIAFSGTAKQYSASGYELKIGDGGPANTAGTAYLQIYDQDGNPASEVILLTTTSDCSKNLIMMNFVTAP